MYKKPCNSQEVEVRKGPWTMEEDLILINYIANHGEGVWNSLARSAGLKRTGKSCRLRWLNYLRPDVRRGNITPEEQLLIMELHSKWGNRWSKIAKHLPGRTDNEIKNYWRTRIQKHMKQSENTFTGQNPDHSNDNQATTSGSCSQISGGGATTTQPAHHHHHQQQEQQVIGHYSPTSFMNNPHVGNSMEASFPNTSTSFPCSGESNDNIWSMDDLWSIQLLNGD